MVTLPDLASKGYFPKELPPPFNTSSFGSMISTQRTQIPATFEPTTNPFLVSRLATHNLARVGTLRRRLSVPNPINFYQLAKTFESSWPVIANHCKKSSFSLSTPSLNPTGRRAIEAAVPISQHPRYRGSLRATSKYVLKADITSFYPSIYTHSIPWALHTKTVAKANRAPFALLGNTLDFYVRNAQDGQTMGVPISPDTSLVLAEMVLVSIDEEISKQIKINGFRSYDDFEFGFTSYANCENALTVLQGVLNEYELQLNANKTKIIELPVPFDDLWKTELRVFPINIKRQSMDLAHYFGRSFELAGLNPEESVLKYAVQRLMSQIVTTNNWDIYQDYLLQCAIVEPGALSAFIDHLHRYHQANYPVDIDKLRTVLHTIVSTQGQLGHGSEVAWAVWGCLLFSIPIEDNEARILAGMSDPFIACLALDARSKTLISPSISFSNWESTMTSDDLYDSQWLIAYEANVQGWLPSVGGIDHVMGDSNFAFLKSNNVHFYDTTISGSHQPSRPIKARTEEQPAQTQQGIYDEVYEDWEDEFYS